MFFIIYFSMEVVSIGTDVADWSAEPAKLFMRINISRKSSPKTSRTPLRFSKEFTPKSNNSPKILSLISKNCRNSTLKPSLVNFAYIRKEKKFSSQVGKSLPGTLRLKSHNSLRINPTSPLRPEISAFNIRNSKMLSCIKQSKITLKPYRFTNLQVNP